MAASLVYDVLKYEGLNDAAFHLLQKRPTVETIEHLPPLIQRVNDEKPGQWADVFFVQRVSPYMRGQLDEVAERLEERLTVPGKKRSLTSVAHAAVKKAGERSKEATKLTLNEAQLLALKGLRRAAKDIEKKIKEFERDYIKKKRAAVPDLGLGHDHPIQRTAALADFMARWIKTVVDNPKNTPFQISLSGVLLPIAERASARWHRVAETQKKIRAGFSVGSVGFDFDVSGFEATEESRMVREILKLHAAARRRQGAVHPPGRGEGRSRGHQIL